MALEGTDDRGWRADLHLQLHYGTNPLDFWQVGVRDIGGHDALNLQKSFPLGPRAWGRLGLIQSKIGLGLDYRTGSALALEAEVYNPDDIQVDLRGIYKLHPGWSLLLGVADSFGDSKPFIGMRKPIIFSDERKDNTE